MTLNALLVEFPLFMIYDELRYDRNILRNEYDRLMSTITSNVVYKEVFQNV